MGIPIQTQIQMQTRTEIMIRTGSHVQSCCQDAAGKTASVLTPATVVSIPMGWDRVCARCHQRTTGNAGMPTTVTTTRCATAPVFALALRSAFYQTSPVIASALLGGCCSDDGVSPKNSVLTSRFHFPGSDFQVLGKQHDRLVIGSGSQLTS